MNGDMSERAISPEELGLSAERLSRVRTGMLRFVDEGTVSGLVTVIARKGAVAHFDAIGRMDMESGPAMRRDAIFRIYSMTKPVVCTALMILSEEGRFLLSDPVSKFIPGFRHLRVLDKSGRYHEMSAEPTIHNLLTHTAGLTYDFFDDSPVCELYRQARLMNDVSRSLGDLVAELVQIPLAFNPGSQWQYGLAIDVVAHLIEVLSGRSLADFLKERLFDPLGMVDTGYFVPEEKQDRVPPMYGEADIAAQGMSPARMEAGNPNGVTKRIDVASNYPLGNTTTFARGGHGLYSTATDYLRFAEALRCRGRLDGTRILGRKTVELMHSNHLPGHLLPMVIGGMPLWGYGFGLGSRVLMDVGRSAIPGSVGEFGWAGAARTHYWVDPKEEMVGILMTQYLRGQEPVEATFRILAYQAIVD